jgi:hypothetical protein
MARSDPYAVLGLPPGAPLDEVKRAYRRLAKQLHPDTAGDVATKRFLAVQAAYETIVGGGGARPGGAPRPAARPSQADPTRARATRDAYRTRTGRGWSGAGGSGAATGAGAGPARDGATDTGTRAPGGGSAAGPGAWWRSGPSPAGAGASGAPGAGTGRRRRSGGRKKATLNSTTYDEALHEPFEPGWSGATWYGPSSGTYWTINPKEYADPRKHGPEYQARARRAAGLGATPGGAGRGTTSDREPTAATPPPWTEEPDPGSAAGGPARTADRPPPWADDPATGPEAGQPAPTGPSPASAGLVAGVIALIPALALLVLGAGGDEPVLVVLALVLPPAAGTATAIVAGATGRGHA